jgi:hypothetical protein
MWSQIHESAAVLQLWRYVNRKIIYHTNIRSYSLILRESLLLIDEVDLVLHPLKSELNYPIGPKEPLDCSNSQSIDRTQSNQTLRLKGVGLRWGVVLHLLEVFYIVTSGTIDDHRHR